MKASMYFNYASRSLVRGGQRSLLAIFCVAVGVLAIVALQLVGQMINGAFTSNVRDANGGDIAVTSLVRSFTQGDLAFFDKLKRQGQIEAYTPTIGVSASTSLSASLSQTFVLDVIDPQTFPVVTPPTFVQPSGGSIASLVTGNQVVVTQAFADQYHKRVGDTFTIYISSASSTGRSLQVRIAGVIANAGVAAQSASTMYMDVATYHALAPNLPLLYGSIYVSTGNDQARTDRVVKEIQSQFYYANTQTASDALKSNQQQVDSIRKFLEIAGLLALLIGGVGIVNTMQVLLSRRRTEIAMLKTTGYRRRDLYLLFGLEAGLLGLLGGTLGAAAGIGVSVLVRALVVQTFGLNIPLTFDPLIIGGGLLIGLCTALIFGLMPIVQGANIRPLSVLRELPEGSRSSSYVLTAVLLLLLSLLFCILAIVILNNDVSLGVGAVYGTFFFLAFLSIFFGLTVFIISILPVPEHLNLGFLALILIMLVVSGLIALLLPTFGILLVLASLAGLLSVFLPRTWKANLKMALRNIGRQRARTTTTMLALFVGIFTIGLILILGQDLRDAINSALANSLSFNVLAITSDDQAQKLQSQMSSIPGLKSQRHTVVVSSVPLAVNGSPIQTLLPPRTAPFSATNLGREGTLYYLSTMEGYDLAHNQVPTSQDLKITEGRNLTPADAGTNNVLVPWPLVHLDPLKGHLGVGGTITLASADGKVTRTVTVVGVYQTNSVGGFGSLLASSDLIKALSPGGQEENIFYLKIDQQQVGKAIDRMGEIAGAISVLNLANIGDYVNQVLGYMLLTLTAIASLSLFAGVIIIANAVALAMLERRRELGILKAVGYTSRSILSEVLIENGVIGGTGAFLAMLLVTFITSLLSLLVFKTGLGVSEPVVLTLIIGAALLSMAVAALVAWGAVRVRPLEVLRYE
jgi:putative ABC transport system permease protein